MRRRNILLGTLALAVVVATIGGVAYALHTRTQAQADGKSYPGLHGPVSVVCPGPPYGTIGQGPLKGRPQHYSGQPSIRPRNDCTPSFTQQDVRDYVAHGAILGFGFQGDGQPTVTRVIFLTIGDLGRATGDRNWETNNPADMLVCYAGLSGTFSVSDGFGPPTSINAASIVFDAHTGNTLVTVAGPLRGLTPVKSSDRP
jgi:hypothetical protein